MRIIRGLDRYPADAAPCVVAQGTFDGIHLGHQAVIRTAVERAQALGVPALTVTFDPLPIAVLRPDEARAPIVPLDERLDLIAGLGPDATLVVPFTPDFSRIDAAAFVRQVLVDLVKAREVVVGFNHTFGRGAAGTPDLLIGLAAPFGIRVHVVPALTVDGLVVSSTSLRECLRQGDVTRAGALLGRPYSVRGRVGHGARRGRLLGFPTANLRLDGALPLGMGVYVGRARWDGGKAAAVVNVGVRPTFDEVHPTVEAHLLDVDADLYGRTLSIAFLARIRDEMRFPSVDALKARIAEDVAVARRYLAGAA